MPLMIGDPPGTQWLRQQNRNVRRVSEEEPPAKPENVVQFPTLPPRDSRNLGNPLSEPSPSAETRSIYSPSNMISLSAERAIRQRNADPEWQKSQARKAFIRQRMQQRLDQATKGKTQSLLRWNDRSDLKPLEPEAPPESAVGEPAEFGKNQYTMEEAFDRWWILHSPTNSDSWAAISNFDNRVDALRHIRTLLNPTKPYPVR